MTTRISRIISGLGLLGLIIGFSFPATRAQIPAPAGGDPRGFGQHQAMQKTSPFNDLKWQFIGPTNISGRVTDVAVAKRTGQTRVIYVATATGGVWRTDNEGTTWEPVFDQAASTSIGDVTVAPSDPNIVWVGTGEANIFRTSPAGAGVYKSLDGGKTWAHMGLTGTQTVPRIIIHPTNPDIVYVASTGHEWTDNEDRGVFKTIDGGKTWQRILWIDAKTGVIDLVMDPADPNVLYAASWQRVRRRWNDPRNEAGYSGSGIRKTTDGGKTWTPANEGLPAPEYRGRIGLDVARSNPNILYAFVDSYRIARKGKPGERDAYGRARGDVIAGAEVYRSADKGKTWVKVSESNAYMENVSGTYGWVFGQIRVDPNDENTVYIMGLGLSVSSNGGKTFERVRLPGGDLHALWIDPENSSNLLNGNDQGFVASYDKGRNWRTFATLIPAVQFFNVAFDMGEPFRVYGSIQDHGSRRGVVDLSKGRDKIPAVEFTFAPGGEGSHQAIDPTNPNIVYSAGFYGNISRTDFSTSDAQGRPRSTSVMPKVSEADPPLRGQWLAPFIISPHNSNVVYHGLQLLFRSWNRGESWERISPDLTDDDPKKLGDIPYQTIFAIAESPKRFGLIYVGTDDGRVHVTRDGGQTWAELTANLPRRLWVSRITASRFDEGTVYLTQTGRQEDDFGVYIWKSADFGKTWKSLSGRIPTGPVNVIREDPTDPRILYVGTDLGVYVSTSGGESWDVLGAGLPSTFVFDLIVHPRDNIVVAATHGRGMWALDAVPVQRSRQSQTPRP
jgi:photosystem II stability/assembly factor-like uncharacterized protein